MAVFIDGALTYSAVIPIGAKNVTNDLAVGLRVSLETAEKIKLLISENNPKTKKEEGDEIDLEELGIPEIKKVSKKTLAEGIIRPRLNEIFSMVKLELERENLVNRTPSGVIITGGGAGTVGILEAAKRTLFLPARIGKPKGVSGLVDEILEPAYATVVGLVLYGTHLPVENSLTSISKRIKLPTKGLLGKLVSVVKDLLP